MGISSIRSKYTPAGANREIQINDNGVLGSSSGFVLNSSGYVGIGVNNPLRGLHLEGDSGISAIRFKTTGGEWDFAPFWSAFDDGNFSLNRVSGSGNLLIPSGNVGIGLDNPSQLLHLSGAPATGGIRIDEESNTAYQAYLTFLDTSGNFGLDVNGGGRLRFATGGSENLTILSSGNVGIGDNNPAYPLVVKRDLDTGGVITRFFNSDPTYSQTLDISFDSAKDITFLGGSGTGGLINNFGTNGYVWQIGGSEKARITSSGNVGIGEPSPAAPLHVKAGTPSTTNDAFHISDGTYTNIVMRSGNADGEIRLSAAGTLRGRYAAQYAGTRTGHNFSLGTNDITAITIDTDQNVGVGTTTPVSLSNQTSLTIDGTSIGRLDLKAGGAGGGNIYGSGTEFAWAANSGIVSHFYGAASQPMKYTIGSNEVARFTQANGSGGLTLKTNAGNDLISMGPEGSGGFEEKLLLRGYNNGTISFQFAHSVPNFINTGQNFGIGEDAPPSLLTLKGGNILLEHNSTGADDGHGIFFHTTTNGWSEAASHAAIYGKRVDASNGYLRFDTRSGGTTAERMRLGSDGVVYVYGEARTGVTVPSDHKGAVLQLRGNTQWEAGYAPTPQNSDHDGVIEFFTSDTSGVGVAANTGKVAASIRSTAQDPYGRYSLEIYTTDASGDSTTPVVDSLVGRFYKYGGNYATGTGSGDGAAQFSLFGASDDTGITDSPGSAIYLNNYDSTVNNYTLLNFRSMVSDGTNYPTAQIRGIKTSDNTVGSSWVSGALAFDTVSAGTGSDSPGSAGSFQERMRIHSDGAVSIGSTTLNSTYGILNLSNTNGVGNSALYIEDAGGIGYSLGIVDGSQAFSISEGANLSSQKRFEIDTNGGTIIGGADIRTLYNDGDYHTLLYMEGTPRNDGGNWREWPGISIIANNANTGGAAIDLGHARGTALGNNTAIVDNDSLGALSFAGADGTAIQRGAVIHAQANGDWSGTNRGTDIAFQTTINGATSYPAERMRIASQNGSGSVLVGKTTADAHNKGDNTNLEVEGSVSSRTYIASNVGTSTWVNSGFTVGNQMRAYIITIFGRPDASNTYSTAMYVLVSSAYSKVLTQLGTPSSHFGNGELEAQLDSNSAATVNFQVRWAFNSGNTQTSDVHTQVLRLF
jgi:hypothetical protein